MTQKVIVDNKFLEMSNDEHEEFKKICAASEKPNCKGEEIFRDRFATDEHGRIIYLKALGNRFINFEAVFFLVNLMQNQHLRAMYKEIDALTGKVEEKLQVLEFKEKKLDEALALLKVSSKPI
jgi:hypothetical protein